VSQEKRVHGYAQEKRKAQTVPKHQELKTYQYLLSLPPSLPPFLLPYRGNAQRIKQNSRKRRPPSLPPSLSPSLPPSLPTVEMPSVSSKIAESDVLPVSRKKVSS